MLPRSSVDILASAVQKRKRAAPKRALSGFEGDVLTFDSPLDLPLRTCASAEELRPSIGSGPSLLSPIHFKSATASHFDSRLCSPSVARQQEGASGAHEHRAQVPSGLSMSPATTTSACLYSVYYAYMNALFSSSSDTSIPQKVPESRPSRISRAERIQEVLTLLRGGNLSPFDVVLEILDERNPEYSGYRNEFYKEGNQKMPKILDHILAAAAGKRKLWTWMRPYALVLVCEDIDKEMNTIAQEDFLTGLADITPDFIKSWTVENSCKRAPVLTKILQRAAQTSLAKTRNKKKHPRAVCFNYRCYTFLLIFCDADV